MQTQLFQACLPNRQNGVENRDKAYSVYVLRWRYTESFEVLHQAAANCLLGSKSYPRREILDSFGKQQLI